VSSVPQFFLLWSMSKNCVQGLVLLLEGTSCVSLIEDLLATDMPQVQGQLIHMLQQRMQMTPPSGSVSSGLWDTPRVGHMVMAGLLRVARAGCSEQSTDEGSFDFIKQEGFEEPLVAALNLLRYHVMRRSTSGAPSSFSQGFLQVLSSWRGEDADLFNSKGVCFVRAILSCMRQVQSYAELHVGAAVLPSCVVVHAAEMLLEELENSMKNREQ
jgi:hypothetical protein